MPRGKGVPNSVPRRASLPRWNKTQTVREYTPEYRAQLSARVKAQHASGKMRYRKGVPDGMRAKEAEAAWQRAAEQADKFIKIMEDNDKIDAVVVPGSEEEMAKETLREAYKCAVSPMTDLKVKATYQRLVLDFTKAKPESKSKLTLDKSEEWLAALEADMKSGD